MSNTKNKVDMKELNEALQIAQKYLNYTSSDRTFKTKRRRKKVIKAVNSTKKVIEQKEINQMELDRCTNEIWKYLINDDPFIMFIIFLTGLLSSLLILYVVWQTVSYNKNMNLNLVESEKNIENLIGIHYGKDNIYNLNSMMALEDSLGIANDSQEMKISNDHLLLGLSDYLVHYSIKVIPLNNKNDNLLDLANIKYKYSYKDSKTGKYYESKIGTFADLPKNEDGSLVLIKGTQVENSYTDFKISFWVSIFEEHSVAQKTYSFKLGVNASI